MKLLINTSIAFPELYQKEKSICKYSYTSTQNSCIRMNDIAKQNTSVIAKQNTS